MARRFYRKLRSVAEVWWSGAVGRNSPRRQIHLQIDMDSSWILAVIECKLSILRLECVYMYRSIGGLCCNVLIQRVPCHALHIVLMFGDLPYELPYETC